MKKWLTSIAAMVFCGALIYLLTLGLHDSPPVLFPLQYSPEVSQEYKTPTVPQKTNKLNSNEKFSAEDWFEKGLKLWQGNGHTNPDEAIKYFSQAARLDPSNPLIYLYRGRAYEDIGREDKAYEDFKKACDMKNSQACGILFSHGYIDCHAVEQIK